MVCEIVSIAIQKRLLAEKDLTLQKTMEIAQGTEAATKQSSELHTPSGPVSASQDIQLLGKLVTDVEVKDIHKKNAILRRKENKTRQEKSCLATTKNS